MSQNAFVIGKQLVFISWWQEQRKRKAGPAHFSERLFSNGRFSIGEQFGTKFRQIGSV